MLQYMILPQQQYVKMEENCALNTGTLILNCRKHCSFSIERFICQHLCVERMCFLKYWRVSVSNVSNTELNQWCSAACVRAHVLAWNLMKTATESHRAAYLRVSRWPCLSLFWKLAKRNATPPEWSESDNAGPKEEEREVPLLQDSNYVEPDRKWKWPQVRVKL